MPNIESAKKRVEVTAKKTLENKMVVSRMRSTVKKYNAALSAGDFALAEKLLPETVSVIDAACSDGALHKNNAARKVAQLNVNLAKAKENAAKSAAKAAEEAAKNPAPVVEEVAPVVAEEPKKAKRTVKKKAE